MLRSGNHFVEFWLSKEHIIYNFFLFIFYLSETNYFFFLSETKRNILIEGKIQEKEKKKETKETTRRMRGPSYTN